MAAEFEPTARSGVVALIPCHLTAPAAELVSAIGEHVGRVVIVDDGLPPAERRRADRLAALAVLHPRLRLPALALAAVVAASRPYLGVHYWTDVVIGAALGAVLGYVVARAALAMPWPAWAAERGPGPKEAESAV